MGVTLKTPNKTQLQPVHDRANGGTHNLGAVILVLEEQNNILSCVHPQRVTL